MKNRTKNLVMTVGWNKLKDKWRKKKDSAFGFFAKPFSQLHPNTLTIAGLASGMAAAFLMFGNVTAFVVLLAMHLFLDGIDGTVARMQKNASAKGSAMDYTADRLVAFTLIISAYLHFKTVWFFIALIVYIPYHLIFGYAAHALKTKQQDLQFIGPEVPAKILFLLRLFEAGTALAVILIAANLIALPFTSKSFKR